MHRIALSLGSNLGNRAEQLERAVDGLRGRVLDAAVCSALLETPACNCEPGAPPFLNAAVVGDTALAPWDVLQRCQQMEQEFGRPGNRQRGRSHQSRVLDIDILLVDQKQIRSPRLVVPHPQLCRRRFVLAPLAEIAPDWPIPPSGIRVVDALKRLSE